MSSPCSSPIYNELFPKKSPNSQKKKWLILHIFCHVIQKNINKKTTHFYHANLEKNVYKMVAWVIYGEDYS